MADNTSKKESMKQLAIFSLPGDIIFAIFEHFDKSTCLNAMGVCRLWYNNVPQYSQHMWTKLNMHNLAFYERNTRWQHCIGDHVKTVVFDQVANEDETLAMMRILINRGCSKIERLQFLNCGVFATKTNLFLKELRQLGMHLTELSFNGHRINLPFVKIIHACPKLVEFNYAPVLEAYQDGLCGIEPDPFFKLPEHYKFESLTSFCFNGYMDKIRFERILQNSPNLRQLVFSSDILSLHQGFSSVPIEQATTMDLDALHFWCPKLLNLEFNCAFFSGHRNDFIEWKESKIPNHGIKEHGIRYLKASETSNYGPSQIGPLIQRNANTLCSLTLTNRQLPTSQEYQSWSHILGTIQIPQLRKLELRNIQISTDALAAMLSRCRSLETLFISIVDLELNLSQVLQNLKQLKQLQLAYLKLQFGGAQDNSAVQLFKDLAARKSELEMIDLHKTTHIITDELLAALARLPKLKVLKVELDQNGCTDDGFGRFVELLDGTTVENLQLKNMQYIPRETFESIGNLKHLKTLRFISPPGFGIPVYADGNGLMRLLRKSKLDEVYFDCIRLFSPPDSVKRLLRREPLRYELTNLEDYAADFIQNEYSVRIERVRD